MIPHDLFGTKCLVARERVRGLFIHKPVAYSADCLTEFVVRLRNISKTLELVRYLVDMNSINNWETTVTPTIVFTEQVGRS